MKLLNRLKRDAHRGTEKAERITRRWQMRRRTRAQHPNRNPRY